MSHIVVITMTILLSLFLLVVLFSVHAANFHKGLRGLSCVNDYVNNISCTWESSAATLHADCWVLGEQSTFIGRKLGVKEKMIESCKLKRHINFTRGCNLVFEKKKFSYYNVMPYIRVECNGTMMETITDYKPVEHIKMHAPGVPNVNSTANETIISWRPGSLPSNYLKTLSFQTQIKQKHQTWNEAIILPTLQRELCILAGKLKGHCEVRVRVKPILSDKNSNSHWSNWSPTTSWTNEVETSQNRERLLSTTQLIILGVILGVILGLITVTVCLYRSCASRGLLKGKPLPNPSKYFHTLHSVHGGNLKNWLNPLTVSEAFFTAQPRDPISPLEMCESWDVAPPPSSTSALLHCSTHPSATSGSSGVVDNSSSSCFSNMGYFISSSSGNSSVRTDPNPAYFTYREDFHNHLLLNLCSAPDTFPNYESLKKEPQSPDSGFGFGKEDEEFVEDEEVFDDHPPLLTLPLHLPLWMCSPFAATTPPSPTLISPESQQEDVPAAGDGGSWPSAGSMSRSSSMPVEPCRTGYMTLKELQTTFSNKSI
ncbi:interleukin-2 receptor subunit beta isoform X1 [Gymnodraco acuticeps]|uniref:Interleukin-2 receptor subunit beta isoform X1 n=2 Tax=Gymnodraco acuticeps TaxID=8218 RepID=A0A6P8SY81_GYMAC|nr:interleukin-2 receptor subunit beta isoform X1 [Gymnodraco acuticeps]